MKFFYYDPLEEQCPAKTYEPTDNKTISVTGEDPCAIIANLDPRLEYCVAMAAKRGAGVVQLHNHTMYMYVYS